MKTLTDNTVVIREQSSWSEFQKLRVMCGNRFPHIKLHSIATSAIDTEFSYLIKAERKNGKRISKELQTMLACYCDGVIDTLRSF